MRPAIANRLITSEIMFVNWYVLKLNIDVLFVHQFFLIPLLRNFIRLIHLLRPRVCVVVYKKKRCMWTVACRGLVTPGATCLIVCPLPNSSIKQWRMVDIVTGYMPFVMSQYIFLQFVTVMNVNYQRSKLGDQSKIEHSTLKQCSYNNCKNILQRVKTRE